MGIKEERERGRTGITSQELARGGLSTSTFTNRKSHNSQPVHSLQNVLRNSLGDESDRTGMLSHLINREHTVTDEVRLGRRELGEDKTGAIAEEDIGGEADRLEVLRLSGSRRDGNLLFSDEGVDSR